MFAAMSWLDIQRRRRMTCAKRSPRSMKDKLEKHREKFVNGAVDKWYS